MSRFYVVFIFLFSMHVNLLAQEDLQLNEDFLNSLPEDAREELLKQIEEDSTKLKSVEFGIFSSLLNKNAASEYIEQELLDKKVKKDPETLTIDELKVFGSEFFSGFPTTFMPISEPSLNSDYVLDIGDNLDLEIFGPGEESLSDLIVSTDGTILVPGIGAIQVAGLSVMRAQKNIIQKLNSKLPGSDASLRINSLRNMQLIMVGFVEVPGIYTLPGNTNVISAIRAAGGISSQGSYRSIEVKRNGALLKSIDLYDLLINGDTSFNIGLRTGDTIVVRPSLSRVYLYGGVSKPAIYEFKNENVSDVLNYAGGSLYSHSVKSLTLTRREGDKKIPKEISYEDLENHKIKNDDEIYVPYVKNLISQNIQISGAFTNPGIYSKDYLANNNVLASLSDKAYTPTIIHKKFNSSSVYSYDSVDPLTFKDINDSDKFIAFTNQEIDFLNSSIVKDLFNGNLSADVIESCKLFSYLSDANNSSMFLSLAGIINKAFPKNNDQTINNQLLNNISENNNTEDLFVSINKQLTEDNCPEVFNNDPSLFISLIQNSIYVEGMKVKGGLYPIHENISLRRVLSSVTNYSKAGNNQTLSIAYKDSVANISLSDSLKDYLITYGTNISIGDEETVNSNRVRITGEINKPGDYFIAKGERLSSVIEKAGNYTENSYPLGGVLIRRSAQELEKEYNNNLYKQFIKSLSSEIVQGNDVPFETVSYVLNEFKSTNPTGRVITEFNLPILKKNHMKDIILESGDEIFIPKQSNIVYVFGEVINPGPQVYSNDYSANDYISSAGGVTSDVDSSSIILILPNGQSKIIRKSIFGSNVDVLPGSVIFASRDVKKLDNIRLASTLAPIVSSIAISLASLNSISND